MAENKGPYATITPYLLVPGIAGLIEFLKQAFDAEELLRLDGSNGRMSSSSHRCPRPPHPAPELYWATQS